MSFNYRAARTNDLSQINEVIRRSKAHWGYDEAFLNACKDELTLTPDHLTNCYAVVAEDESNIIGIARVDKRAFAKLHQLFVDPVAQGMGVGAGLFNLCVEAARRHGAFEIMIDSDPNAQNFYESMGCELVGTAPSISIPGRMLPTLRFDLS